MGDERVHFMPLAIIQEREDRDDEDDDDDDGGGGWWWWCKKERGYRRTEVLEQLDKCGSSEVLTMASHVDTATVKEEGRDNGVLVHSPCGRVGGVSIWGWTGKIVALYAFNFFAGGTGMKPGYQLGMWEGKGCSRVKKKWNQFKGLSWKVGKQTMEECV